MADILHNGHILDDIKIIDLPADAYPFIHETAVLLFSEFKEDHPDAWPTMDSALAEVKSSISRDKISKIAIYENVVVGWVGGIPQYKRYTWELHPLVVHTKFREKGIGRKLVAALENEVVNRGGMNLYLGSDDENFQTSISGKDLYPGVLENIKGIKNLKGHPYEFYLKIGFEIVGVIPDASGPGKPDIFMAKRIIRVADKNYQKMKL